jgi:hypothetical protein
LRFTSTAPKITRPPPNIARMDNFSSRKTNPRMEARTGGKKAIYEIWDMEI